MPRYFNRWPYDPDEPEAPDRQRCRFELPDGTHCGLGRYPGAELPFCIFHQPEGVSRLDTVVVRFALQEAAHRGAGLWGANLEGADLWAANLYGLKAGCANFRRATLVSANLQESKLGKADLQDASLMSAYLDNAHLRGTNLRGAKAENATFRNAALVNANLQQAKLRGANLQQATLLNATLPQAELREASLRGADLTNANLEAANFIDADLRNATMVEADLHQADMRGANLQGASLRDANLEEVHLRAGNLRDAELHGAKITGSADLAHADLTGAHLADVTISPQANLDGVVWGPRNTIALDDPEKDYVEAERVYRQVKQSAEHWGQYDRAGAFFFEEMECKRKAAKPWSWERVILWLYLQMCGYGEQPWRAVTAAGAIFFSFTVIHAFLGLHGTRIVNGLGRDVVVVNLDLTGHFPGLAEVGELGKAAYFSLVTFSSLGYGDIRPAPGWGQFFAGAEVVLGAFMMALFLVTFTRKFRG